MKQFRIQDSLLDNRNEQMRNETKMFHGAEFNDVIQYLKSYMRSRACVKELKCQNPKPSTMSYVSGKDTEPMKEKMPYTLAGIMS